MLTNANSNMLKQTSNSLASQSTCKQPMISVSILVNNLLTNTLFEYIAVLNVS